MKWIKYQIVQCEIDEEVILATKKVGYSETNLAIAEAESYGGEYEIVEDSITIEEKPLGIEFGGTGANTLEEARRNLCVEPVDNLLSEATNLPLSANQGRLLGEALGGIKFKSMTQAAFNALTTKDANTLYIIT